MKEVTTMRGGLDALVVAIAVRTRRKESLQGGNLLGPNLVSKDSPGRLLRLQVLLHLNRISRI